MDAFRRALLWLLAAPFRLIFWLISLPFRFLGWLFSPVADKFRHNSIYRFLTETPEDRSTLDALAAAVQSPMQILDELEIVRKHLLRSLLALIITVGVSLFFTNSLITFLAAPIGGLQKLYATRVTDSIGVFMTVALMAGIALATPYIAFEIWLFIAPGLMPRSRQIGLLAIPLALVFFLGGAAFTYFFMLPPAIEFLIGFLPIQQIPTAMEYISLVSSLIFWVGVAFEFPLVIFALSAMGLVQPDMLLKQWRIAIVLIAIIAAAITPTVDPVNQALMMAPMIALYFLSILFSYLAHVPNKNKEQAEK
jgi:sec-independent protein translocase protein TatC